MVISKLSISALKPCKDRFDNYVNHYGDKEFTPRQFMGRKSITHEDKIWVAFRLLSTEDCAKAAADIAESVLHHYESAYPGDLRPRRAIEAARTGVGAEAAYSAALSAAAYSASSAAHYSASSSAYSALSSSAALSADYSARSAASSSAAHSSSAAYYSALSASSSSAYSAAQEKQEKLIRTILLKYLK